MNKVLLLLCAVATLLSSCGGKSTTVKNENKPDSATMMKNWTEYMTPGPMHQLLAATDGEWIGETTMWMNPDEAPSSSNLDATYKMVLGGRYQVATHTGTMMGMPFEGVSTTGYDNAKKKFINTWIDNSGTGVMILEGNWDEAAKTITYKGKCVAAEMGDGSEMGVKQVLNFTDATHHEFTMYMVDESGKETKTMYIKYTKK